MTQTLNINAKVQCPECGKQVMELVSVDVPDPVILIGIAKDGGGLAAVGLFETAALAHEAVHRGDVRVDSYVSLVTVAMNTISHVRDSATRAS